MLNRTPPTKKNTTNVINSYRKRRQSRGPLLIYTLAAILLIGGVWLVVRATTGGNNPIGSLFPTDTPTPTLTFTPTSTVTPSLTPTKTLTPTETLTPTPSGPFSYVIVEGDTLQSIADKFNLGSDGVPLILDNNPDIVSQGGVYYVGETITIPAPGTVRNTPTLIPANVRQIQYQVLPGDTLAGIAAKFNSKEDDIISLNKLTNPNSLQAGDTLQIRVNLVTPTPTLPPTSTPVSPTVLGQPTQAPITGNTPSSSTTACTPSENPTFTTDLLTLINNTRTSAGLNALNVNDKLTTAAKVHAIDMVCNNYLSRTGLDGSTPQSRVAAQGYTASLVLENMYAFPVAYGINPQVAFNWWNNDPPSQVNMLNPDATEVGIAYEVTDNSMLGGYFVVVFAKP